MVDITILYEDEHIIAINKPAGIMAHGDGRETSAPTPTVADWFIKQYPGSATVGEDPITTDQGTHIHRPGIVHRLDRDTSGVMLLARTSQGHASLKQQFQDRTITKVYLALVYGIMKHDEYTVDSPIGRSRTFGRWTAIPKSLRDGGTTRSAETTFSVIQRLDQGPGYSLIEARPKTGRTHQIRVHLQYLNYPIVADHLYAGKRNRPEHNVGFTRQALHAQSISFENVAGQNITVKAPLPQEFSLVLDPQ